MSWTWIYILIICNIAVISGSQQRPRSSDVALKGLKSLAPALLWRGVWVTYIQRVPSVLTWPLFRECSHKGKQQWRQQKQKSVTFVQAVTHCVLCLTWSKYSTTVTAIVFCIFSSTGQCCTSVCGWLSIFNKCSFLTARESV